MSLSFLTSGVAASSSKRINNKIQRGWVFSFKHKKTDCSCLCSSRWCCNSVWSGGGIIRRRRRRQLTWLLRKKLDRRTQTKRYVFNYCLKLNRVLYFVGAGRKKPLFEHHLWNVYDRVVAGLPRSNNSVEGWHNAFAGRVSINHPNIIKLTEKIRREQSKFEIDITKLIQGHQIKTQKACYRKLDERIERLVGTYDSSQLHQYLDNIAANISL